MAVHHNLTTLAKVLDIPWEGTPQLHISDTISVGLLFGVFLLSHDGNWSTAEEIQPSDIEEHIRGVIRELR